MRLEGLAGLRGRLPLERGVELASSPCLREGLPEPCAALLSAGGRVRGERGGLGSSSLSAISPSSSSRTCLVCSLSAGTASAGTGRASPWLDACPSSRAGTLSSIGWVARAGGCLAAEGASWCKGAVTSGAGAACARGAAGTPSEPSQASGSLTPSFPPPPSPESSADRCSSLTDWKKRCSMYADTSCASWP